MGAPPTAELTAGFRAPFAADRLMGFLALRAVPGLEEVRGGVYRRAVRPAAARPSVLQLAPDLERSSVRVLVEGPDTGPVIEAAREAAVRLLDLDADASAIDRALAADPALAPLVRGSPGTRVPGSADGFELVVRAIVGQQVSVSGARTTLGRIVERFGEALDRPVDGVTRAFPDAVRLADAADDAFGMPRARARTIVAVARAVAEGELDLSGDARPGATLDALAAIPGIGPWTLAYVAMRAFRNPDAFPETDLGVRRGLEALGLAGDPGSARARADRWRPYRAYATMHLWSAA